MSRFNWAPTAYRLLDGLFCVFKPGGVSTQKIIHSIKLNLCKDLNALPCYEHEIVLGQQRVKENLEETSLSVNSEPSGITDWSEHRLVLGDRYEESDFNIHYVDGLARNATGVLVMSVGSFGRQSLDMVAMSKFLRVYHVKGRLGYATDDYTPTGNFLERTSFKHVSQSKLTRLCAAAQAAHTRQMYSLHGVNPDSQEAYEMAAQGIIRPRERKTMPILYSVKCIDFQPPNFTLEVHSINETTQYLQQLVHDLAIKLKSSAVCTGVRRLRYGFFDLDRSLLRQHWHLDQIVDNIRANMDLLTPERLFVGGSSQEFEALPIIKRDGYLPDSSSRDKIKDIDSSLVAQSGLHLDEPNFGQENGSAQGDSSGETVLTSTGDSLLHEQATSVLEHERATPFVNSDIQTSTSSGDMLEQRHCNDGEELVVKGTACKLHSSSSSSSSAVDRLSKHNEHESDRETHLKSYSEKDR